MGLKKWVFCPNDKPLAKEIAEECNLDPVVTMLAVARGYTDPWQIEELLSDEIMLNDPSSLTDINLAADRIRTAITSREKILIFGDYDCDGVTATVLLYEYLSNKNADVAYAIPRRDLDGYGLNSTTVEKFSDEGTTLIITVDNGISAFDAIETANERGVDVIVTDHHLPKGELPNAYCVVDPHREDDYSEFKFLSGVGVAFKLVCAVEGVSPEEMLPHFADLVTIGTIADVMPLLNENRSIVKFGLTLMQQAVRPGIKALIDVCGLRDKPLTASSIAFALAPRINAAGRMCDADIAVRLLLSNHFNTAYTLAKELNDYNNQRQEIEQKIVSEACRQIEEENFFNDSVLVLSGRGWHCGVIGIAAARIAERYGKPAILFAIDGDTATGSGRSIHGFDLFSALEHSSEYLLHFGGHEQAAGAGIETGKIDNFRKVINSYARHKDPTYPQVDIDCKLNPAALSVDFVEAISLLEPFGAGNNTPVFALCDMQITRIDMVGKENQHMRITARKEQTTLHLISFSSSPQNFGISVGDNVDFAVTLSVQEYNGRNTLNIIIKDIRSANREDETFFSFLSNYRAFLLETNVDYNSLYPIRSDFAFVFRFVKQYGEISLDGLQNHLATNISPDKVAVIVQCFNELGIFLKSYNNNGMLYVKASDSNIKVDLEQSKILHTILEKRV